jgi:PAS domain S-box-containing protein
LVKRVAVAAGGLAVLIGGGHVAAWLAGLMPHGPTSTIIMKTNAGLGLLGAGLALMLIAARRQGPRRRRIAQLCAAVTLVLGLATLSEHVVGWNLGIDQLLATESAGAPATASPNRMGPPASLSLALLGTALLLLTRRAGTGGRRALHEPFALASALLGLLAIIGYLYDVSALYQIARLTGIAWPTALSIVLLAVGVLCAEPDHGLIAHVTAPDPGGAIIRGLLGPMLLLPLVFGWLRLTGERLGWFDAAMGTSLIMLLFIVTFSSLVLFAGYRVSVASAAPGASAREARRQKDLLEESEARLRAHMDNSPLAVIEFDPGFRVTRWSSEAERLFGWTAPEVTGRAIAEWRWVHEDDVEAVRQVSADMLEGKCPRSASVNRNYRKDGSVRVCEWYNSAIYDGDGRLTSILSQVLDITERKKAEADRDADLAALTRMHTLSRRGIEVGGSAAVLQETIDTAVAVMQADKGTCSCWNATGCSSSPTMATNDRSWIISPPRRTSPRSAARRPGEASASWCPTSRRARSSRGRRRCR